METNQTPTVTIKQIMNIFDKMYANMHKEHLAIFEKEMQKLIPTQNSEVFLSTGADYSDNSINLGVFISNPQNESQSIPFNNIAKEWLFNADCSQVRILGECLIKMEQQGTNNYDLDFTSIHFNKRLGTYSTNIRFIKELE